MENNNCNSCTETDTFLNKHPMSLNIQDESEIDYSDFDKFLHSLEEDDAVFSGVLNPLFGTLSGVDFFIIGVASILVVVLAF